jgi:nicotinamidase-related amidase
MKSESILLITSAQNDLLAPTGGAWSFVRATVEKNNVPKKLNELTRAARASGIPVIHSPIELDYLAMADFKPLSAIQQVVLDNKLLAKGTRGSEFLAWPRHPIQGFCAAAPAGILLFLGQIHSR